MILNNEQKQAYNKIENFLKSKHKIFVLNGPAGTGKTTVISQIFKDSKFSNKKIVLSATTNKAVSVIEQMSKEIFDNIDYSTIHKICNVKRKIDYDGVEYFNFDEKPVYNKNKKSIYNYDIIVIDEASMINLDLLKYLYQIKNKIRGKLIFVGDTYQLPPVNENESKVFDFNYFDDSFLLNKIERFNSNILNFSIRIRDCIDNKHPISLKGMKDNTFYIFKNETEWKKDYLENYNIKNTFLAYTNKRCEYLNKYIRTNYFKQEKLPEFIEKELIVFNNYYTNQDDLLDDKDAEKFYTSNTALINSCDVLEYKLPKFPVESFYNLKQTVSEYYKMKKKTEKRDKVRSQECPICYDKITSVDNIIETDCKHVYCESCIRLWLEENKTCPFCRMNIVDEKIVFNNDLVLTEKIEKLVELTNNKSFQVWKLIVSTDVTTGTILVIKKEDKFPFQKHRDNIKYAINDLKKYIYKNLKNVDNRFVLKKIWDYYYNYYIDFFADISYGYCITVHKSQGSTFDNVYIDSKNILEFNRKDYINYKCLYTAITRASKSVKMLI